MVTLIKCFYNFSPNRSQIKWVDNFFCNVSIVKYVVQILSTNIGFRLNCITIVY